MNNNHVLVKNRKKKTILECLFSPFFLLLITIMQK